MPVEPLFRIGFPHDKEEIIEDSGQRFKLTYFKGPTRSTRVIIKERIHSILDDSCLGITRDQVTDNINTSNYSLVAELVNITTPGDRAICTLQNADWCDGAAGGGPQVWVNDVCRISDLSKEEKKAVVSPVAVLLKQIERIVGEWSLYPVNYLWLNVAKGDGHDILVGIYTRYGYSIVSSDICKSTADDTYTVMNKYIGAAAGAGNRNTEMATAGAGAAKGGRRRRLRSTRRRRISGRK